MPPKRGSRGHGRHGRDRGTLPVAVEPREVDETTKTCAAGERMVLPCPSPPRAVPSGRADHDPYRNQPFRGSAGGRTGPPPSCPGAEPVPCQDHVALPPSAQPVSYLDKLMSNITLKESVAPILVRKPPDWYFTFYIRTGLLGSFHTYPRLDGPFKSLQEADDAIDRHLLGLTDPKMSKDSLDKLSIRELAVRKALYFPDGTRRKDLQPLDETLDEIYLLVHALVDKYNDDHNLLEDRALQLKDVQRQHFFFSRGSLYYHFNFTTSTKGLVDPFFAEVKCTKEGEHEEMVVSCFCSIKYNDNGHCYGCLNNGAVDMKHPKKADAYCRGRVNEYMSSLGGYHMEPRFESIEEEEERLRYQFKCFDDTRFMAEHFPNRVKTTVKT